MVYITHMKIKTYSNNQNVHSEAVVCEPVDEFVVTFNESGSKSWISKISSPVWSVDDATDSFWEDAKRHSSGFSLFTVDEPELPFRGVFWCWTGFPDGWWLLLVLFWMRLLDGCKDDATAGDCSWPVFPSFSISPDPVWRESTMVKVSSLYDMVSVSPRAGLDWGSGVVTAALCSRGWRRGGLLWRLVKEVLSSFNSAVVSKLPSVSLVPVCTTSPSDNVALCFCRTLSFALLTVITSIPLRKGCLEERVLFDVRVSSPREPFCKDSVCFGGSKSKRSFEGISPSDCRLMSWCKDLGISPDDLFRIISDDGSIWSRNFLDLFCLWSTTPMLRVTELSSLEDNDPW